MTSPFAAKFGFYQRKHIEFNKSILVNRAFNYLKSKGFSPAYILDVGANHGTWTRDTLKVFPNSTYILVEPQAHLEKSIQDLRLNSKINFYPIGLGNQNGVFEFAINQSDDSSSFRPSDSKIKGYEFGERVKVQMKTLDAFLKDENLPIPELVKIDAEGLDLEVLKGSSSIFGITECILVEAAVHQKAFPNSLLRIMNIMDEKGYEIFDFTDLNRPFSNGLLWLVEVMFVKKGSRFV
ncbi:FkbM family methyltransferase [Algoriphagus litoralis]|uniref:FkbM family methyltransferase n=1 Tax=Algoriphagus litoralis TaxID=2202829 RepID=UPI0013002B74|nr:FkbM family methyltransferase [Algoriphagus litoralis]